ncbi:hypothetical protein [Oxynema aestuarii]|jgi:hypothetical protein|uniref:Uncharacterized protein n=1 Tax=Oxynema aestuarii AP17 TaxID=2064643 RepID=A0A6H1U4A8_9CYAN|nr:hypothetical protein [Oxynema aestuarii]QIZ72990.1 hypothetical protein HCG48_22270 [Oxynema aestuarii AP17]
MAAGVRRQVSKPATPVGEGLEHPEPTFKPPITPDNLLYFNTVTYPNPVLTAIADSISKI